MTPVNLPLWLSLYAHEAGDAFGDSFSLLQVGSSPELREVKADALDLGLPPGYPSPCSPEGWKPPLIH